MKFKALMTLALILASLAMGVTLTACTHDDVGQDYYENEKHGGYPGPATRSPGREG